MLRAIALILLILWLIGFAFHLLGHLIHLALVVAVIMLVVHFVGGRNA